MTRTILEPVCSLFMFAVINVCAVDLSYAKRLASTIHVYCYILTEPSQLQSQRHVQNTWVRRCTYSAFISPGNDSVLKILDAGHDAKTYKRNSWNSMRRTLRAIYATRQNTMYFVKANYNDYIILENLRYMLEVEDPDEPFLMGRIHEPGPHGDRISGSAGYVLSKKAMELIVKDGLDKKPECEEKDLDEDVQIGLCAAAVGVDVRDNFDFLGKSRFSNVPIEEMLGPYPNNTPRWLPEETDYTLPKYNLSKLPASPLLVSFTGIDETMMYVLEYLLYHLRPHGITHRWMAQKPKVKPVVPN
ncbi:unnamed protein product [Calicophoron daubneyi]|uniref:Glycoprotein-N-acetylgalactosamine 3-beta-galactosyltransferase 1 n=1 Tax=Calicophoron daubneyi TaxID=300641 RepID=A0AAV2SWP8_CALDB